MLYMLYHVWRRYSRPIWQGMGWMCLWTMATRGLCVRQWWKRKTVPLLPWYFVITCVHILCTFSAVYATYNHRTCMSLWSQYTGVLHEMCEILSSNFHGCVGGEFSRWSIIRIWRLYGKSIDNWYWCSIIGTAIPGAVSFSTLNFIKTT